MATNNRLKEGKLHRDDAKYRDGHDNIDFADNGSETYQYSGKEVPKEELPAGVRCRIVYGGNK